MLSGPVRRSSVFRQLRWARGDVLSRNLRYFGINRTVPAGEKPQFKKLMKPSYHHEYPILDVDALAAIEIEKVLGKSVSSFRQTKFGSTGLFFVGKNKGNEYSEFHFGAGESSIIRIISEIESLPNSSLVLIEEIENGLHPVAVRCLVEYLIAVAERKSIQSIFTTHSDDALDPLPPEAIWSCLDGQVQQGKLSVAALRAVTGRVDTDLVIFSEDKFSNAWINGIYDCTSGVNSIGSKCTPSPVRAMPKKSTSYGNQIRASVQDRSVSLTVTQWRMPRKAKAFLNFPAASRN